METMSEKRSREAREKDEAEQRRINKERNARLTQQAIDAQKAQRTPKAPVVEEATPEETTPVPVMSEEEEYKKNRPRYFK